MIEPTSDVSFASNSSLSNPPAELIARTQTRLLLVDDDDFFRESLGLNLIDEGFAVTSFSNGNDTLKYFEAGGDADVLLLDWRMPGMDGLEVLRQMRSDSTIKHVPVVMLTSSREEQDLVHSYELGVNAYVVKPVDFQKFVESVKQIGMFWAIVNEPPPGVAKR